MDTKAHATVGAKGITMLAMALALVAVFGWTSQARAEGFVVIGGGVGHQHAYRTSGHYETTYQSVMVSPAHMERQWVAPVYQTTYDRCGNTLRVLVSPGYWTEVYVPAQYETREVQVWVADYERRCAPAVGLGVGFRF